MLAFALLTLALTGCGPKSEKETKPDSSPDSTPFDESPEQATMQTEAERSALRARIDPRNGTWRGEVFAEEAGEVLKHLGALLQSGNAIAADSLGRIVSNEIAVTDLRPGELENAFEDQGITVRRQSATSPRADAALKIH